MNIAIDQLSKATKTQAEAQISVISAIAEQAIHAANELAELNVATVKASLEDGASIAQELISAKDPQSAFAVVQAQAQPAAEKAASYGRHLAAIASKTQAELGKIAQERLAETSSHFHALVNDLTKVAPAGSEPLVDAFKSGFAQSNAFYEQFAKAGQTAYEQFQSQLNEMTSQFGVPVKPATKSKKAAASA